MCATLEKGGQHRGDNQNNGSGVHKRNLSSTGEKTVHQKIQKNACATESPVSTTKKKGWQVFHGTGVPFLRCEFCTRREPLLFLLWV